MRTSSVDDLAIRFQKRFFAQIHFNHTLVSYAGCVVICSPAVIDAIFAPLRNRRFSQ